MLRILLYLIGTLLYVVFPRDLIPDFLVGWGWIDDIVILYIFWRFVRRLFLQRRPETGNGQTTDERQSRTAAAGNGTRRDPYAILEISAGATQAEIKAAYRRLAAQYHPDKVQHLGKEIRELAELRFKEIQAAHDLLTRRQP